MRKLKIPVMMALAVILQPALRQVWPPLVSIDLPLIVIIYVALQREVMQSLIVAAAGGIAADALGSGLLGAGGFSKTLTGYLVLSLATRINIDNPLARIPVLAGSALLDSAVYVGLHTLLGQRTMVPFIEAAAKKMIWTTIVGTLIILGLEALFSDRARQRRLFAVRRRVARRNLIPFLRRK